MLLINHHGVLGFWGFGVLSHEVRRRLRAHFLKLLSKFEIVFVLQF